MVDVNYDDYHDDDDDDLPPPMEYVFATTTITTPMTTTRTTHENTFVNKSTNVNNNSTGRVNTTPNTTAKTTTAKNTHITTTCTSTSIHTAPTTVTTSNAIRTRSAATACNKVLAAPKSSNNINGDEGTLTCTADQDQQQQANSGLTATTPQEEYFQQHCRHSHSHQQKEENSPPRLESQSQPQLHANVDVDVDGLDNSPNNNNTSSPGPSSNSDRPNWSNDGSSLSFRSRSDSNSNKGVSALLIMRRGSNEGNSNVGTTSAYHGNVNTNGTCTQSKANSGSGSLGEGQGQTQVPVQVQPGGGTAPTSEPAATPCSSNNIISNNSTHSTNSKSRSRKGKNYNYRRELSSSLLDHSTNHSWANSLSSYYNTFGSNRSANGNVGGGGTSTASNQYYQQQQQRQQEYQDHQYRQHQYHLRHWSDAENYNYCNDYYDPDRERSMDTYDRRRLSLSCRSDPGKVQHTQAPFAAFSKLRLGGRGKDGVENGNGRRGVLVGDESHDEDDKDYNPPGVSVVHANFSSHTLTGTTLSTSTVTTPNSKSKSTSSLPVSKSVLIPQYQSRLNNSSSTSAAGDGNCSADKSNDNCNGNCSLDMPYTRGRRMRPPSVTFSTIEIRQYERILGDNPSCSSGPSISIGWNHLPERTSLQPVDEYEYRRTKRNDGTDMVLTRGEREQILMALGYTKRELITAVRSNVKLKKKRRQTVNNLPISPVEEIWEGASKKVGRMMRKRPGSKYLYKQWINSCEAQEEDGFASSFDGERGGGGIRRAGLGAGANFNIIAHEESSRSGTSTSTGLRSALKKSCSRSSITCANTNTYTNTTRTSNRNTATDGCSDFVSTSYLSQHEESPRVGEELSSDYSIGTGQILSRSVNAAASGCTGDITNNSNEMEEGQVDSKIIGSHGESEHSNFSTLHINKGELVSSSSSLPPSDNKGFGSASERGSCRGSSAGIADINIMPQELRLDQGQ